MEGPEGREGARGAAVRAGGVAELTAQSRIVACADMRDERALAFRLTPMDSATPTISVLMPVYNAEKFVSEAIESILRQTYTDFEFLIVDDGSTDDSVDIVNEYAQQDKRIVHIVRPHAGLNTTLNEGLKVAKGKYLARMDADDISLPQRFARQVKYLDAHPECVLVGSRVMLMDMYGSPFAESFHKLSHDKIDAELLRGSGWALVHPATMMVRKM